MVNLVLIIGIIGVKLTYCLGGTLRCIMNPESKYFDSEVKHTEFIISMTWALMIGMIKLYV